MSLVERIDLALLGRADAFVAWNVARGGAGQWALARACLDMAPALLLMAALVDAATSERSTAFEQLGYVVIGVLFLFMRRRENRSMGRLSRTADGNMRARTAERDMRQTNILIMAGLAILCLIAFEPADIPFVLAVMAMDAAFYFKAADAAAR